MKSLTQHGMAQTRVKMIFHLSDGTVDEKTLYIPKWQKDEAFNRIFEKNPHVLRMIVEVHGGKIIFDKSR